MGPASAGLVFDATELKETADVTSETHEVRFSFRVEGTEPITIENVTTSCSCISAGADKKVYQPGETGEVKAVFKLGAFEGEQLKTLQVHSSDSMARSRQLQVRINIPKVYELTPEMTTWTVGEEPEAKTVTVKVLGDQAIEITEALSSREAVKAELREITKGREYQVVLKPDSTEKPMLGAVKLSTSSSVPRLQSKTLYFNIMRPRGARAKTAAAPAAAPAAAASAPAASGAGQ